MNGRKFYLLLVALLSIVVLSLNGVLAQESTETPGESTEMPGGEATEASTDGGQAQLGGTMVTCDSDLILLLYVAERYFDYSSFNSQMSSDMMVDVSRVDRGQYSPWFDELDGTGAVDFSDETRSSMNEMLLMSDEEFDAQMAGDGTSTTLNPEMHAGEAEECAALRASLRRFFFVLALNDVDMSGMGSDSGDSGTGSDSSSGDSGSTGGDTGTGDDSQAGVITVNLTGAAEVPGPGDEDASGTATVYLRSSTNEVCVDISVQNIALPATAAHIHQAAAGQSGPPVVTLTPPNESGVSNTCVTVDAALMQEMVINPQNFYVNVHNSEFPDGAARGQLQ